MDHALNDDLDSRLRAARPAAAIPDADACDTELLARVRRLPIARRSLPRVRVTPLLVGAAALAAVVGVTFGGGPASVGGPDTASAVTAALQWFAPPAGTVLHTQSVETMNGRTVRREFWQLADHPTQQRLLVDGGAGGSYEQAGGQVNDPAQLYDPVTNTIYESDAKSEGKPPAKVAASTGDGAVAAAKAREAGKDPTAVAAEQARVDEAEAAAKAAKNAAGPDEAGTAPAVDDARKAAVRKRAEAGFLPGDPVVSKIRYVLEDGNASVTGHERHDGVDAWVISLNAGLGRPAWTLWVDRADGRPLELRDPGRTGAPADEQTVRWTNYEVLHDAHVAITLAQAHPSATRVRDAAQFAAAEQRLTR